MLRSGINCTVVLAAILAALQPGAIFCGDNSLVDAELRQKVERLIAGLDAETRSERATARDSLTALGPRILPLLPDDRHLANDAIRDAVRQIRLRLERQSAQETLAVSRVTLNGTWPLREILKQITSQTLNVFDVLEVRQAILDREFSVNDHARPFWSACDELVRKSGVVYVPTDVPGRLKLETITARSPGGELAVTDGGPFRVSVLTARLRSTRGERPRTILRIGWSLMAEPRLRPLFARIAARDLVVLNSDSKLLKPTSPAANIELSFGDGLQPVRLETDFDVPSGVEPTVVDFSGSLHVEMAAGPRQIVFDDLGSVRRKSKRVGSVTVGVRSADFPPENERGTARLEVSVLYDQSGPAFESYRTWIYRNEVVLETRSGRRLRPQPRFATRQQGDGSIVVEYNFSNVDGKPSDYRLVYVAPTLITELPVKFQFAKIPTARTIAEGKTP